MSIAINWSPQDVSIWLEKKGHGKYSKLLTEDHCIDGRALLLINETDLKTSPINITVSFFYSLLLFYFLIISNHI